MTSKKLKSAIWLVLAVGATALAAGPGSGGGGGGGGGGGKPTTEATNNLSVPAIMAGGVGAFALNCSTAGFTDLSAPDKPPVFYPESCAASQDGAMVCVDEGYYYKQRDAKWQAPCFQATTPGVQVLGAWGDNLIGDARLKVGSPIRVELVLWDSSGVSTGQKGYKVIKLEPAELDRVSDYGHLAKDVGGTWYPIEMDLGAIVHDPAATLKIERVVGGTPVPPAVYNGVAGGEINATGKIVYGYNLRVTTAGTYRITYKLPNVQLSGCEEPQASCTGNEAVLDIVVAGSGGGGKPIKPAK